MAGGSSYSTLTDVLATYAALLSTFGLGWTLYRDLRDRAKLRISVGLRKLATGVDGKTYSVSPHLDAVQSEELFIVINVLNVGRRPVKITGVGGKVKTAPLGDRKRLYFFIVPHNLPRMLDEWENVDELVTLDEIRDKIDNLKYFYVKDASSRLWKAPRKQIASLKRDIREQESKRAAAGGS